MGRRVSFYTDEHVAKTVIRGLRGRGVDVMTVAEAGLMGASDEEHLARALKDGRVTSPRMMISCGSTLPVWSTRESPMPHNIRRSAKSFAV